MANVRRVCRVVLTGAGQRLMSEILPLYYTGVEAVWGEVPVAEAERLSGQLERVAAGAERAERMYREEGQGRRRRRED
jgi:hypothetical protein